MSKDKRLMTIGDMREHLGLLMSGLRGRQVEVDEAMAAARLAEQINAAYFAEAKIAHLLVSEKQPRPPVGSLPLNKPPE